MTGKKRAGYAAQATILAALAALVLGWGPGAVAGEVDCDTLFERIRSSSETFRVGVETAGQKVRVETRRDHCFESIANWARRDVAIPPGGEGRPVSAPSRKAARNTKGRQVARVVPLPPTACDKELGEFWQPQDLTVEGTRFWLSRIFTIDTDNDGVTDDVGFILKAEGQTDLIVRYIRVIGKVSGRTLPGLGLADEADIQRLCFGQITFQEPAKVAGETFTPFKIPDLSRKAGAEPSPSDPREEEPTEWWPEALGASIFLVFGFGSAGVLTRFCRSTPRRKAGDRRARGRRDSDDRRKGKSKRDSDAEKRTGGERRKGGRRGEEGRRTKEDRRGT